MSNDYAATDKGSDAFGLIGAVSGAGGAGFFDDKESMIKGGLRFGMSLSNGVASVAKGVGAASAAAGPIGAAAAFALDTCINFYEASKDIGKAQSKIAMLKSLRAGNRAGANQETVQILDWLINKIERREMYDHAETGGTHKMAAGIQEVWKEGTHAGRAKAVGASVGMALATPVATVGGQLGSKGVRAGRGLLKKVGLMGSQRKNYARVLQANASKGDELAKRMLTVILTAGIANSSEAKQMQDRIDQVVLGAIEKGMSSFKE
jgi:hypothetical protein